MINIIYIIFIAFLILPISVSAFIPPDAIAQGVFYSFSTISFAVIFLFSGIVSIGSILYIFLRKNRKIISIFIIENLILGFLILGIFYVNYYNPLYIKFNNFINSQLSVEKVDESKIISPEVVNKDSKNEEIVIEENRDIVSNLQGLENAPSINAAIINKYAILLNSIDIYEEKYKRIFFVDTREKEEFQRQHIKDAVNIRAVDVSKEVLKKSFSLKNDNDFQESLIILYCHDGMRSSRVAESLNSENIKFLYKSIRSLMLKGDGRNNEFKIELTSDDVQDITNQLLGDIPKILEGEDYLKKQIDADNILVFDGTIDNLYSPLEAFSLPYTKQQDYERKMQKIVKNSEKETFFVIKDVTELFFVRIIFSRLKYEYNFDLDKMHITTNIDWNNIKDDYFYKCKEKIITCE